VFTSRTTYYVDTSRIKCEMCRVKGMIWRPHVLQYSMNIYITLVSLRNYCFLMEGLLHSLPSSKLEDYNFLADRCYIFNSQLHSMSAGLIFLLLLLLLLLLLAA